MQIFDISLTLSEAQVVWPDSPPVKMTYNSHLDKGDIATVMHLNLGAHTGTHVDGLCHFIKGGIGVDKLDLNVLVGPVLVIEALEVDELSAEVMESANIPPGTERVIFHTRNSALWARGETQFNTNYVAIAPSGARWLVEHGVKLVGVDYLSVAPFEDPQTTHVILLGAGIIALEGLNLTGIEAGEYQLCCLPIKIAGGDGAPARTILIKQ